ncbi:PleD family two-component system response regulator [Agaribacterium sp. ZY112]|uniref:response regulator n=1 Tax=Agaribacterium sp. ZY112 TaxID=3233574 RepID=UPI003526AEB4
MDAVATVLSIDDSPSNQKLIEKVLSPHYIVEKAMSGAEGMNLLQQIKPQLILLDVDLPGKNGFELCRDIRNVEAFQSTPIVFFSCLNQPEDELEAYKAGANDYISKPCKLELLLAKIQNAIKQQLASNDAKASFHNQPGNVMAEAFEQLLHSQTETDCAQAVFNAIQSQNYDCALRLEGKEYCTFNSSGQLSALDDALLSQEQISSALGRSQIRLASEPLSLIVKGLDPLSTQQRYELKEQLLKLIQLSSNRCNQIRNTY